MILNLRQKAVVYFPYRTQQNQNWSWKNKQMFTEWTFQSSKNHNQKLCQFPITYILPNLNRTNLNHREAVTKIEIIHIHINQEKERAISPTSEAESQGLEALNSFLWGLRVQTQREGIGHHLCSNSNCPRILLHVRAEPSELKKIHFFLIYKWKRSY